MSNENHKYSSIEYGKVAVLMGGWSAERDVSLMSGNQVLKALVNCGIDAHAVDADRDVVNRLKLNDFDRVFNILHGPGGEDGLIQGALEMQQIPYTGSGVLASALAINKQKAKEVCIGKGVLTPAWVITKTLEECHAAANELHYPVVIKPVSEGSSIGISIIESKGGLERGWKLASKYGKVMMEKYIVGTEVTATVLMQNVLPLVSMSTDRDFYDYTAKYLDDKTKYKCPCDLSLQKEQEVKKIAQSIFNILDAKGWGRVDFIVDDSGKPFFIELNTIPGMTTHSLVPMAASADGIDFEDLCIRILSSSFP